MTELTMPPPTITIETPDMMKPKPKAEEQTDSCYLCDEENPGDFEPTTKFLESCLLCNRSFCPLHKGRWEQVCNINHSTYYHEHPDLPGVYPSLGEREKALFTSPTSKESKANTDSLESVEQALLLSKSERAALIEEKDLVGADIAV